MLPEFSLRLPNLPPMRFVRELEDYDGPILSEWRAMDGRSTVYLDKWCTREGDADRSIVVRSDPRSIAEYLSGRISMRTLLLAPSDGIGLIVDRRRGEVINVFVVALESGVPASYLPRASTMHDENLRPAWGTIPQSFLIDADWDGRSIAAVERLYHDVSGFLFFTEPSANRQLPGGVLNYRYDRGFPIGAAFTRIRAAIPREQRAKAVGVSAGSPGILTLEASPSMAARLTHSLIALPRASNAYDAVLRWSGISYRRLEQMPNLDAARQQVSTLCDHLGIDMGVLLPSDEGRDPYAVLVAGKLIAAFHRKLWKTVSSDDGQFISVKVDTGARPENDPGDDEGDEDE